MKSKSIDTPGASNKRRTSIILLLQDEEAIRIINGHTGGTGRSNAIRYALRTTARAILIHEIHYSDSFDQATATPDDSMGNEAR